MKKEMILTLMAAVGISAAAQTDSLFHETVNLNEVVVKSTLPKTHIKGDAQITRIAGTVLEKAGSSIDVLKRLPLVEAKDESVSVMGSGAATVFINGREVKDLKELSQLASDRIARVEVVQNPGARYSGSTKAVVRIFLKKAQGEGFSLDNETRYNYEYDHALWENLAMNYRTGGLDVGVTLWGQRQAYGQDKTINQTTYLRQTWHQHSDTHLRNNSWQFAPTLTLNWQISENQFMGMRYSYFRLPKQKYKDCWFDTKVSRDDLEMEHSLARYNNRYNTWNHATNLYYSGKLNDWQIDVNSDLYFSGEHIGYKTDENVTDLLTQQTLSSYITSDGRTRNDLYAIKATAAHPLWGGQVSFGTEDSYTHRTNSYANPQHVVKDDENKINETLLAGFLEYNHQFGKLFMNAGLRYEHTNNNYYEYNKRMDEQSKNYNDWFPSVSLSMPVTTIKKAPLQIGLSYSRDITRPSYSNLRSGVYYDNKYTLEGGNPLLDPTYSDRIVLNAAWKWLNLTTGISHRKNEMTLFSEPYISPDGVEHPEISYLHPIGLDSYNFWYVGLNAAPSIGHGPKGSPLWTPRFMLFVRGQDFKAETKDGNKTFNHPLVNIGLDNHFALPHDWHIDADYLIQTCGNIGNINMLVPIQYFSFGVLKTWCKGKIETRLNLFDPFKQNHQRVRVYNGLRELEELRQARRNITFTFRYKFNTAGSKYKGQSAGGSQKNRM